MSRSIADSVELLLSSREDIKTSLQNKEVEVSTTPKISEVSALIDSIESGGIEIPEDSIIVRINEESSNHGYSPPPPEECEFTSNSGKVYTAFYIHSQGIRSDVETPTAVYDAFYAIPKSDYNSEKSKYYKGDGGYYYVSEEETVYKVFFKSFKVDGVEQSLEWHQSSKAYTVEVELEYPRSTINSNIFHIVYDSSSSSYKQKSYEKGTQLTNVNISMTPGDILIFNTQPPLVFTRFGNPKGNGFW